MCLTEETLSVSAAPCVTDRMLSLLQQPHTHKKTHHICSIPASIYNHCSDPPAISPSLYTHTHTWQWQHTSELHTLRFTLMGRRAATFHNIFNSKNNNESFTLLLLLFADIMTKYFLADPHPAVAQYQEENAPDGGQASARGKTNLICSICSSASLRTDWSEPCEPHCDSHMVWFYFKYQVLDWPQSFSSVRPVFFQPWGRDPMWGSLKVKWGHLKCII